MLCCWDIDIPTRLVVNTLPLWWWINLYTFIGGVKRTFSYYSFNHRMMKYTTLLLQMQSLCLEFSWSSSLLAGLSLWYTSYTSREKYKVWQVLYSAYVLIQHTFCICDMLLFLFVTEQNVICYWLWRLLQSNTSAFAMDNESWLRQIILKYIDLIA